MSKKIKRSKRSNTEGEITDPNLEEVGEDRAFEIEEDEETNEVIFVHHYRRKWGDDFDADVEHGFNYEQSAEMVGIVIQIMENIKARVMLSQVIQKSTPAPIEGNPMQGPRVADEPTEGK